MTIHTRVCIVACTIGACLVGWLAQRSEELALREPSPAELFDAVQVHVTAIRRQHYRQAYLQVSSEYRERKDVERFTEAVRVDFSAARQALRWEFGAPVSRGNVAEVPVRFFMSSGDVSRGIFALVRENRTWKVDWMWVSGASEPARAVQGVRM
jgi:hypothetical protein